MYIYTRALRMSVMMKLRFGGLSVLLVGDFHRVSLLSVQFQGTSVKGLDIREKAGPTQKASRSALHGLRTKWLSTQHFRTLASRVATLRVESDALRVYSRNAAVNVFNEAQMRQCGQPVVDIEAAHTARDRSSPNVSFEQAGRLHRRERTRRG
ncbi:uncharacterized protein IWZ02DRAFT_92651 [Phyllosticta citriasiana]|uniref:uncharacterized protein n=1 Tax=Phyllosticta citriasiana TaxID=595635 RepID=UPI0030FDDBD6